MPGRRPRRQPLDGTRGNAPFIVFDDADLDAAIDGAMIAKMRNMRRGVHGGQPLLRARIGADEFAKQLTAAMSAEGR